MTDLLTRLPDGNGFPESGPDDVLVDFDPEGQRDLLGNALTAPNAITRFHLNDRVDQFFRRPFGPGPTNSFG